MFSIAGQPLDLTHPMPIDSDEGVSKCQIYNVSKLTKWRELAFFDLSLIRDPQTGNSQLYSDQSAKCFCSTGSTIIYSCSGGKIKEFDDQLLLEREFVAEYDHTRSIEYVSFLEHPQILITVSVKSGTPAVVKLWNWATKSASAQPKVVATVSVSNENDMHPITAAYFSRDASVMVFGFGDGHLIAVRGDLLHDKGSRQRRLLAASTAITFVGAVDEEAKQVFVTTLDQVLVVSTLGTYLGTSAVKIVDKLYGAEHGNVSLLNDQLLIARKSQLFTYTEHGKGAVATLPCTTRLLSKFKHYTVLVTIDQSHKSLIADGEESARILLIDRSLKFISFRGVVGFPIRAITSCWGCLNVIDAKGMLYRYNEKPVQAKIDLMVENQLFQLAISVAKSEKCDDRTIMTLRQKYGDYLDTAGDSQGALENYIACLGLNNTSHVILRLRDGHKATELLKYLEKLVECGKSSAEHILLQAICYINQNDIAKLDQLFAKVDNQFDYPQLIEICRNAKLFSQASLLAQKIPDSDLVVQIELLDLHNWHAALEYVRTLSASDASRVLVQHSHILLNLAAKETNELLIQLFTGKFEPNGQKSAVKILRYQPPRPRLIFPSFTGHDREFIVFLEACVAAAPFFQPAAQDFDDLVLTLYELYAKQPGLGDKMSSLISQYRTCFDPSTIAIINEAYHLSVDSKALLELGAEPATLFRSLISDNKVSEAVQLLDNEYSDELAKPLFECSISLLSTNLELYNVLKPQLPTIFKVMASRHWLTTSEILQLAGKCPYMTVGDIRPFISDFCAESAKSQARNEKLAQSYENELDHLTQTVRKLENDPHILDQRACSLCLKPLEMPVRYFACGHIYHEKCNMGECILHNEISAEEQRGSLEALEESLARASDKMAVIQDAISRGALN